MTIPHYFRCPISLDVFEDPVTLSTGQTYDRSSIEKWLAAGNLTCPVTMQRLQDTSLVPNHTLRHLIDQWRKIGHGEDPEYEANFDVLASFKRVLESDQTTLQQKLNAVERIQVISLESSSQSHGLVQLGFLPLMLELLFGRLEFEPSRECVALAEQGLACALRWLSTWHEFECLNVLREEAKLHALRVMFEFGSMSIKESLCGLIEAVSLSPETRELCGMIGEDRKLLQGLVHLIQLTCKTSEAGIRAISALCSSESNTKKLSQEGAASILLTRVSNLESQERSLIPKALSAIELLLGVESAREAVQKDPVAIAALVKMVFRVPDHEGSESVVGSLIMICNDSKEAREEAIAAGLLTQLLLLLQSQCSSRTKTVARKLLKLLRSKCKEEETTQTSHF